MLVNIGRRELIAALGSTAAPLGGFLLAHGLEPRHVFLSAVVFAVVAAAATALLAIGGRPAERLSATEAAQ